MNRVTQHYTAGGVVLNDAGQVLVLLRDVEREGAVVHEVRLPKGHIDEGETPEAAACREVCEESGYCHVEIIGDLGTAVSEYRHNAKEHRREEHYFLMRLTRQERSAPAPTWHEEALFEPAWLELADAEMQLSYPTEQEFVQRARGWRGNIPLNPPSKGD